jgi:hypothetical protein
MAKLVITENQIKDILNNLLSEEKNKVSRQDFNKVQFKIEELQNSLSETQKELRKLEDSIPTGLKSVADKRIYGIFNNLVSLQKQVVDLKKKVAEVKKAKLSKPITD